MCEMVENVRKSGPETPPALELTKEEIITEEIQTAILQNLNRPDLKLVDFDVKLGTTAGDNYGSTVYAVELCMRNTVNGGKETVPVMLKTLPKSEFAVKFLNELRIFVKENSFYSEIAPAIEKAQRDAGIPENQIINYWPKCLGNKTDGKTDYLAMEDLRARGFRMGDRKTGLDFDHCKLVLECQARLHAVTYSMFRGDFDAIIAKYPWLQETLYDEDKCTPEFKMMMTMSYKNVADKLRAAGEELGASFVDKIFPDNYFEPLRKITAVKNRWAVIGHGDCWTNNLMFRYDKETGKPIEVKFVDFQMTRAAFRAVDIHYFLYTSPEIDVLNGSEKELEEFYYVEFIRFAKILGVDVVAEELTWENFMREIEQCRYFGCVAGLLLATLTSTEKEDIPDFTQLTEESLKDGDISAFWGDMIKETALQKLKNISCVHLPRCLQIIK